MAKANRLIVMIVAFSMLVMISSTAMPIASVQNDSSSKAAIEMDQQFTTAQMEPTVWYHDGSNTTGWEHVLGTGTINSSGTELYSPIVSSGVGLYHEVFRYYLDTPIVVGNDMELEVRFNHTINSMTQGGINLMAYSATGIVWRMAGTAYAVGGALYSMNYFSGTEYDEESTMGVPRNGSMWYNSANQDTETDLGDGVVSTDEHAGETRVVESFVLDFWFNDDGMMTYADLRVDWIRLTGGAVTEIDSPNDIEMEYSDPGNYVTWHPEAYFPDTYVLYLNESLEDSGQWNGSELAFSLNGLDPGLYNYTLIVDDELGFESLDTVWVNVTDTTPPEVQDVANFNHAHGTTGGYLSWNCDEPYPDYFIIMRDSVPVDQGSWNGSDLRVSLDGLDYGPYVFEVTVNDTSANTAGDVVTVTIIDGTTPSITPLDNRTLELGTLGEYLNWTCNDEFPDSYSLSLDGIEFDSGAWNGSFLIAGLNGLEVGEHEFELFLNDTQGNYAIDVVFVTIEDTVAPQIDSPSDKVIEYGAVGESIQWYATDLDAYQFFLYRNGTEIMMGTWNDGSDIEVDLDGLAPGTYNFTILVYDHSMNNNVDTVFVVVNPSTTTSTTTTSTTSTTSTTGPGEFPIVVIVGVVGALVLVGIILIFIIRQRSAGAE